MNSLWSTFYGRWFIAWHTPCRLSDSLLVHRTNLLRLKQNIKTVHWSVAVLAVAFVAASVAISVWLLIFGGAEYLYSQLVSVYELSASGVTSNKWLAIYTLLCFVVQLLILPAGSLILVAAGFIFSPLLAVAIFSTVQILCSWPVYKAGQHIFNSVVKTAFAQRRKTLRNNLKGLLTESQIIDAGIDPSLRAEVLEITQFASLSEAVQNNNPSC